MLAVVFVLAVVFELAVVVVFASTAARSKKLRTIHIIHDGVSHNTLSSSGFFFLVVIVNDDLFVVKTKKTMKM